MFLHFDITQPTAPLGWANVIDKKEDKCFFFFFYFVRSLGSANPQKVQLFRTKNVRILCSDEQKQSTECEKCGEPFEQPITLFQHAVTCSCCSMYFYTFGKRWDHSSTLYTLHILRINKFTYAVDVFTTRYNEVARNCIGPPSLFCSASGKLFVTFTVGTERDREGREYVSASGLDRGGYVYVSNLYKVLLDEHAHSFELVEVVLPLPPLKMRMRIPTGHPKRSDCAEFKIVHDELNFHILSVDPCNNGHKDDSSFRLFTMNTDGRAHLFDGNKWTICENANGGQQQAAGAEYGFCQNFSWHQLFNASGRLFMLYADLKERGTTSFFTVGELLEIHVDQATNTFRFNKLCDRIVMPRERNFVACSSAEACRNFSLSQSLGWYRPTNTSRDGKPFAQIFVDSPLALSQLVFRSITHAFWPVTVQAEEEEELGEEGEVAWLKTSLLTSITNGPYEKRLGAYISSERINEMVAAIENSQMELVSKLCRPQEKMADEYFPIRYEW